MNKFNFTYFAASMVAFMVLFSGVSRAQFSVTLPEACNCSSNPSTNGTAIVSAYGGPGCTGSGTINGPMTQGVPVSGVTMTLYANVTQVGTWTLSAVQNGVTFTGSGTFTSTGCQPITLNASGTPTSSGPFTWTTNSSPQGSSPATVGGAAPINAIGAGTFAGKTCFDVAISNNDINSCGPLSARLAQQSNFTQTATNTQTYTFTPSGTVSNVRFVFVNTNGTAITGLTGGNSGNNISSPVTATVSYANTLNTPATGLTNSNPITSDIYVVYNNSANNTGTDLQIKLTANIKDCQCCGAFVSPGVWKDFLCHNLGANTSLDPHNMAQTNAWGLNGAYIQWGRRGPNTTGDSRVDWVTAANDGNIGFAAAPTGSTAGTANDAGLAVWINSTNQAPNFSWRTAGGAKTANDPCPAGWRVPTATEWDGVNTNNTASRSGAWTNSVTYYNSALHYGPNASTKLLTLPAAGARSYLNGQLGNRGSSGLYWSSTEVSTSNAYAVSFETAFFTAFSNSNRPSAHTVRCIVDNDYVAASVGALNCSGSTTTGTLVASTAASNVSTAVPFTGANLGTYSGQSVSSTGVTGLTATLAAGTLNGGSGNVTYTISGTPSSAGTANFAISLGGKSCTLGLSVAAPANAFGTGSFAGKTCFDVAISNDGINSCGSLSTRLAQQSNFTQTATNTQTYTFTPSGTVSNVRFVYVNTNGTAITGLTGGNSGNNISSPVSATVSYANTLNTPATGLTNSNPITSDIYVVYNNSANNTGTDLQIKLTANIKDCSCCGAMISATVWKEFLCHNLGANTSLDPHDMAQANAWGLNGAYIQFGRRGPNTTGDSRVDWVTAANTTNFAAAPTGSTAGTANSASIAGWSTTTAADFSWSTAGTGAKTVNDPCPAGFRMPTTAEWTGVNANNTISRSGAWTASATYYNSALHYGPNASTKRLTLPATGYRDSANGALINRGSSGYYWSGTVDTSLSHSLVVNSSSSNTAGSFSRGSGFSVRCIVE